MYEWNGDPKLLIAASLSIASLILCTIWRSGKRFETALAGLPLPPGYVTPWAFWDETKSFLSLCANSQNPDQWFDKKVARWGNVFKVRLFGTPTVVLLGAEANKFVLSNDHILFEGSWPKSLKMLLGYNSVSTTLGQQHNRVYRAMEQFFGTGALKRFMIPMEAGIVRQLDRWEGREDVEIYKQMDELAYDTILEISMGVKDRYRLENLRNLFKLQSLGLVSVALALPWTVFGKAWRAHQAIQEIIHAEIKKRRAEWPESQIRYSSSNIHLANDVMDLLLFWEFKAQGKAAGSQLSDIEVAENATVLVEGGGSSLAASLTSLIHILAFHPEVVQELRRECRSVAETKAPGEALSWNDVSKLEYTYKVVMEGLRIRTTIPTITKKARQDVVYNGYAIPKGWTVLLAQRQTHNKEEFWPEPDQFKPGRFDGRPAPYTFITFGQGPRKCVGEKYVILNMQLFLYHFVIRYDWELLNQKEEFSMYFTPRPKQGLLVKLKPAPPPKA